MINLTADEFNRQLVSFVSEDAATAEIEVASTLDDSSSPNGVAVGYDPVVVDWLNDNQITLPDFDDLKAVGAVSIQPSSKHGNQIVTINKAALDNIIAQG